MMRRGLVVVGLAGCGGSADTDIEDTGGACGAVTTWNVTVIGAVEDAAGAVSGASVRLEDRGWTIGDVLGDATTDADGRFTLEATGVTSVEGCWGTVLDYRLVAEEGGRSGEDKVNSALFDAIDSGSLEADVSEFPIQLE
jgi:hypothetical protein